jgi:hypothetical protein
MNLKPGPLRPAPATVNVSAMIPPDVARDAAKMAHRLRISPSEFLRRAVDFKIKSLRP